MSNREVDATSATAKVAKQDVCKQFGTQEIDAALLERFERVTGHRPHVFLRRGLYFAHRDLDRFLDAYEQGRPVYIYTGRGPSSEALHLGHMIPFYFTKWLQDVFGCYVVIQITDDEKLLRDKALDFATIDRYALSNIRDIMAVGLDMSRTFIFLNSYYMGVPYRFSCEFERTITLSALRATFGFTGECNTGYVSFPPKQMQPAFYRFFPALFTEEYCRAWWRGHAAAGAEEPEVPELREKPGMTKQQLEQLRQKRERMGLPPHLRPVCLIPSGYEQDPYFRVARDSAQALALPKPCTVLNSFVPALQGADAKMSASDPQNAVYMTDTAAQIKNKINKHAFSGGRSTAEEQRQHGADVERDVSIQYLRVFMEDDEELADITEKYRTGQMLTGEVKKRLIEVLQQLVRRHQEARAAIADETVRANVYGWGRGL